MAMTRELRSFSKLPSSAARWLSWPREPSSYSSRMASSRSQNAARARFATCCDQILFSPFIVPPVKAAMSLLSTHLLLQPRKLAAALFLLLVAGPLAAQSPATHEHGFRDAEKWAHVFDDPARDAWQKPHEVIEALSLKPDAVVADIGAGTGYFATRLASMLPRGRVYAIDVEPDMVKYLTERAQREGRRNLIAVAAKPDDPRLPDKIDLLLLVDVYHHIEAREQYLRRLRPALKPGGRIAIIDFRLDSPGGPPRQARIAPEQVKAELAKAGYTLYEEHSFLPRQYFLVFHAAE